MTSAEVDTSSGISTLDEGDVDQRFLLSDSSNDFLTFEHLFNMSHVEQLRAPTLALLKTLKNTSVDKNGDVVEVPRYTETDIKEAMIGFNLMVDLHFGRTRKNTGFEEATHPALVGILDLLANQDLTVDQLVTDYLHDVIEDVDELGITAKHVSHFLKGRRYPKERAEMIAIGVEGLTRDPDDPKNQTKYLRKIETFDTIVPPLKIKQRKLVDARQTMMSYNWEMRNGLVTPKKAKEFADGKANSTLMELGDSSPNTSKLKRAIGDFNGELGERNRQAHMATRETVPPAGTVFNSRVRV